MCRAAVGDPRGARSLSPDALHAEVAACWSAALHRAVRITRADRVGGGCVSPVARVQADTGDVAFLKWQPQHSGMFEAEAAGLRALGACGAVRVPAVIGVAADGGWLLLEWLEPGRARRAAWRELGGALAALHACGSDRYGWTSDNFIGPLPQQNAPLRDWPEFWRERRLAPQLARAEAAGLLDGHACLRVRALLAALPELLAGGTRGPSLVHGDLWSGNVLVLAGGGAALVDPAAYYGAGEVDLAMAELFGGFDAEFFDAYDAVRPSRAGWPVRRATYQLYYLLVHVNLFGAGYVSQTMRAVAEAGF